MTAKEAIEKLGELKALYYAGVLTIEEYTREKTKTIDVARRELFNLRPFPAGEKPRRSKAANA